MATRKVESPILARMVGLGTPIKDRVWHGPIFSQLGHSKGYVKLLSTRRLLVECVAAVVGRAHDLPIPRPHLVWAASHQLPGCPEFEGWLFGSEDGRTPCLARLTRARSEVEERIRNWKRAPEAAAFDAWIANADRTSKNLLWSDDSSRVQLIDHDDAFPEWLTANGESANEIMRILCDGCDQLSQRRNHKIAVKSTEHYAATNWETATSWACHITDEQDLLDLIEFLTDRLQHLPHLLAIAAGSTQQDLPLWQTISRA